MATTLNNPQTSNDLNTDQSFLGRLLEAAELGEYYVKYNRLQLDEGLSLMPYSVFFSSDAREIVDEACSIWCETRNLYRALEIVPEEMQPYFKFVFDCKKDQGHDNDLPPTTAEYTSRQNAISRFFSLNWRNLGGALATTETRTQVMIDIIQSKEQVFYLTFVGRKWLLEIWTESETRPLTYHEFVVPNDIIDPFIDTFPGRHHSFTSRF